ncbi:MAG: tetratricopeptide repeat protein [Bacteroidota bacterium]
MIRHLIIVMFVVSIVPLMAQQDQTQNMFRLAQALEQQGEIERSLQIYSDLFAADSNNFLFFDAVRRGNVQLKRYDAAIQLSINRLRKTPNDISLLANIGGLYATAGKEHQSDSVWNIVLRMANKNQNFYRIVANEQVSLRLFDKAIGTYVQGRKDIGDQFLFAGDLGYLYSFMMDYSNMTREYLLMIRQNEQQFDFVQSRLASVVTKPDALNASAAVVEEELRKQQSVPLIRLQLWLLMEANRYSEAFTAAQKLESLVSSQGLELFNFAERVFRENEFTVAAAAYQQSIKNNQRASFGPAARYGYARCIEELSLQGHVAKDSLRQELTPMETKPSFSGAIGLYAQLAKEYTMSPTGANALYRIGLIRYKQMFDLDGALQVFDSVLTVTPAGALIPTVLSTIGDICIAQNKLDAAAAKFRTMSSSPYAGQDQKNFAQFRLAEIRFFGSDFDSAVSILKPLTENLRADESNDALLLQYFITENKFQFPEALKQFARSELLARQGKLSESLKEFASIIDLYPTAPLADDVLLKIAEYHRQLKHYSDALAAYKKLLEDYKESTEKDRTHFKMGELFQFDLLDKQKAIEEYEVVLEKFPFSLFADEARKRIRLLRGDSI